MPFTELGSLLCRIDEKTHWGLVENCPDWTKIQLPIPEPKREVRQRIVEIESSQFRSELPIPPWIGSVKVLA